MNIFFFFLKAFTTGVIAVGVSEVAKKNSYTGALIASLPLTSVLAMVWLYRNTQNLAAIQKLSWGIFWLVIPSLSFFVLLPLMIRLGAQFIPALLSSCLGTFAIYLVYVKILKMAKINF